MKKFQKSKPRLFPCLQQFLPANLPSVNDFMSWSIASSLTGLVDDEELQDAVPDALRAKNWYELTAFARFKGNVVDFYVLGFDAKRGLVGTCFSRQTDRTGLYWEFDNQEQFDNWSTDYGYDLHVDPAFTPRSILKCEELSVLESRDEDI